MSLHITHCNCTSHTITAHLTLSLHISHYHCISHIITVHLTLSLYISHYHCTSHTISVHLTLSLLALKSLPFRLYTLSIIIEVTEYSIIMLVKQKSS